MSHKSEGWAEKTVGSQSRFLLLCVASVCFWGLIVLGIRLAVRASVMYATTGESLSVLHRGVWVLVYGGTFFAAVVLPVIYLTGMRSLVLDLKNKQTKNKG